MKLSRMLIAMCGLVLVAACTKKDDDDDKTNSNPSAKKQMLLDGKWQMSADIATATYMGRDTTFDLYAEMDECDKDDFILFADNGTSTIDEAANKCADDYQIETIAWALLNDDTRIALVDSNPDTFDIEISSTQFKLKLVRPNSSGTPITYISTYKNIK